MKKLRWGRSISNNFIRWSCPLLAMIILSLAFATCLAGASHAASVDRLYAVSFNGSQYPPGTGLVNDTGNVSGNIYLYAVDPAGGSILWNLLLNESCLLHRRQPVGRAAVPDQRPLEERHAGRSGQPDPGRRILSQRFGIGHRHFSRRLAALRCGARSAGHLCPQCGRRDSPHGHTV